jgi:hypothetical protein
MVPTNRQAKKTMKKGSTAELPILPNLNADSSYLPPPPILSKDILERPPILEEPKFYKIQKGGVSSFNGEYGHDILSELEQSGFGSILRATPPKKPVNFKSETLVIEQFREATKAYLTAADKHLELNFIENAAVNYSCAVLCVLLSTDAFQAAHLMKELGEKIPSSIHRSQIFQGVKMVLKANLLKNPEFLVKAEELLLSDLERLYNEDRILIRRATSYTEKICEEE